MMRLAPIGALALHAPAIAAGAAAGPAGSVRAWQQRPVTALREALARDLPV
ncbi:MAG TPA: hypothetical protein VF188_02895 [Longimicrobiales bacterium]